ncbi:sugar ABC transporter substrate-binding protein [Thermoflavimicrobium dichotomicum]|uniref:Simple sugar transport system substrate-binding protein n=1 Tax=Thermoflavimicrobium dichotomicum TaxID=46223 RepID=A0A1I3LH49_9BACL|nr:sugar ABC transporter substrate-binding protein [Thermoflavimicrobium dichotomicum]SFI83786.1 simple sugar transport system substrate-binding protein [Thermoflavimicrobium dichotomicum]
MKHLKALIGLLLIVSLFVAGCTNEQDRVAQKGQTGTNKPSSQENQAQASTSDEIPAKLKKPIKVAAVTQFSIGTFSSQYISGVKEQVEKFGGQVQIYNADNDLAKMASYVETAINQKVDGILIDHGKADALAPSVRKAVAAGIPVVAFDSDLDIPGVTVIDQDDYTLAWNSLRSLAQDINGKGNIVYIWVAGFTPMERRNVIYEAFKKRYPNIKEIARFGNASSNTALDTQSQMEALLKKYPKKGDIAAVFAPWDEFAKGATRAIQQAGRTEIKVYGIDLSDEDLQLMQAQNSPWTVTTATDPADVGRLQVRFLYQKIAGEPTPQVYSIQPHLVDKRTLPKQTISMKDLGKYVPGWGQSQAGTSPWMKKLIEANKK